MTAAARCGVVVDSGAALAGGGAVAVVPLRLEVDGVLVTETGARGRLSAATTVRTAAPSPGEYLVAMRAVAGEAIVVLTMAAELSGMHAAALVAARLYAEEGDRRPVTVVDTRAAAGGLALAARITVTAAEAGGTGAAVAARAARAGEGLTMIGTLRTLAPLARSGRLPGLVAGVADRLRVQPVFELRQGRGRRLGLARTEVSALRLLTAAARERAVTRDRAAGLVFHTEAPERAAALADRLADALPGGVDVIDLPAVAGAYTGPGMVGVALVGLEPGESPLR